MTVSGDGFAEEMRRAGALSGDDVSVFRDTVCRVNRSRQFGLEPGEAGRFLTVQISEVAQNRGGRADGCRQKTVVPAVPEKVFDEVGGLEVLRPGHAAGKDDPVEVIALDRVFDDEVRGHRDSVRAGDDRAGHADGLRLHACAAQDVERAERFDLFEALCQKQIEHLGSSFYRSCPGAGPM